MLEIAANVAARARRLGREEIQPAHPRDSPPVGVMGLQRAERRPVLEMWRAHPRARNRLPGRMQARWLPRWLALGAPRVRASTHELMLEPARIQVTVRGRGPEAARVQAAARELMPGAARALAEA